MKLIIRMVLELLLIITIIFEMGFGMHIKPAQADETCSTAPVASIEQLLDQTSQAQWQRYLEEYTGEIPVMINGSLHLISNRYTHHLFDGSNDAMAFLYTKLQLAGMGYPPNSASDHYGYYEHQYEYNGNAWKNLILTIPGLDQVDPHEIILSAHLDDLPDQHGPGADDNGTGAAALLEMARVLRYYQFKATIKLVWFTGEEQGLKGSYAYVLDNTSLFGDLIGVINLDKFGYDADNDDCFEIHAGDLPASYVLGDCVVKVINAYDFPLTFDYIKEVVPLANSDHRSFWAEDFGAIEILENQFGNYSSDPYQQCGTGIDTNPYFHTPNDTIENSLNVNYAFNIVKASLTAGVSLAGSLGACFNEQPLVTVTTMLPQVTLDWQAMGAYVTYRLSRSTNGCSGPWEELADNISVSEYLDKPVLGPGLAYHVEAISPSSTCISLPSNCATVRDVSWAFMPVIYR